MRILPINTTYNHSKKHTFGSTSSVYKLSNNMEMGLFTWMFRKDLNWDTLADFEIQNFKNKNQVNIIQFAPSDGSEGYTKILSLINKNPQEAKKFFPIKAYDINDNVITRANSGNINLNDNDLKQLEIRGIDIKKYFECINKSVFALENNLYKATEELRKRIQFNIGDMFEILPKIKDNSNTIILARNSLGYYEDKATSFISKASEVLKSGSLFIVGALEEDIIDASIILKKYKFEPVLKNVYRKI